MSACARAKQLCGVGGGAMNDGLFWLIPIVAIIGGITSAIVATITRGRIRELEIRERIAMVERGLVPPPEVDPRGFDRAMDRHEQRYDRQYRRHASRPLRHLHGHPGLPDPQSPRSDPAPGSGTRHGHAFRPGHCTD